MLILLVHLNLHCVSIASKILVCSRKRANCQKNATVKTFNHLLGKIEKHVITLKKKHLINKLEYLLLPVRKLYCSSILNTQALNIIRFQ